MRFSKYAFLMWVLLALTVVSQEVTVEPVEPISDPSQVEQVYEFLEYTPAVVQVQSTDPSVSVAWFIDEPVNAIIFDDGMRLHIWAPPGVYPLRMVVQKIQDNKIVNWQKIITLQITPIVPPTPPPIPPTPVPPTPPPTPTPNVPDDDYGNLGQELYKIFSTTPVIRPLAAQYSAIYKKAADDLEAGRLPEIADSIKQIETDAGKIELSAEQRNQLGIFNTTTATAWKNKWPMTREEVVSFYRAVVAGLSVVPSVQGKIVELKGASK